VTLQEAIARLDQLDDEATLYVAGRSDEWTAESDTGVGIALLSEDEATGRVIETRPAEAEGRTYFLEVAIAKEILAGWAANQTCEPSLKERVDRVIYYARFDA
jgi:hypothetical protein